MLPFPPCSLLRSLLSIHRGDPRELAWLPGVGGEGVEGKVAVMALLEGEGKPTGPECSLLLFSFLYQSQLHVFCIFKR